MTRERRGGGRFAAFLAAALVVAGLTALPPLADTAAVPAPFTVTLPLDRAFDAPSPLLAGAAGAMWVAADASDDTGELDLVDRAGAIRRIKVKGNPHGIAPRAGGGVWFSTVDSTTLGRADPSGATRMFPTGIRNGRYDWPGIVTPAPAPAGGVWFDAGAGRILVVGETGKVLRTYRPLDGSARLLGSDRAGRAWLATQSGRTNRLGLLDAGGKVLWTAPAPAPVGFGRTPYALAPDGSLWIGVDAGLARVAPDGKVTAKIETSQPLPGTVMSIAFDREGNTWFATQGVNALGELTSDGTLTSFVQRTSPVAIAFDSKGTLWSLSDERVLSRYDSGIGTACLVPSLYGLSAAAASTALTAGGCTLGKQNGAGAVVWGQTPEPQTYLAEGATVDVLLGTGTVPVTGTWAGEIATDDVCFQNGLTEPGNPVSRTLRVTAAASGALRATFVGPAAELGQRSFTSIRRKGNRWEFSSPSPSYTMTLDLDPSPKSPTLSVVIAHRLSRGDCSEFDSVGDLLRTAAP